MSNNARVGGNVHSALMDLKNAGFKNLRLYQLDNGAINVEGEQLAENGQTQREYRRVYSPRHGSGSKAAYKVYRRVLAEFNYFAAANPGICGAAGTAKNAGSDFVSNQVMAGVIGIIAMLIVLVVMVASGTAKL